jgi:2-phosphosulfolactate phosphatase
MTSSRKVRIDAFPDSAFRYLHRWTIVCVDVITSGTTAVTAVAQGRRTFAAGDVAEAFRLAHVAEGTLGEGSMRFDVAQSPAALARRSDRRPLVLVDPPGTRLLANCRGGRDVYVACLRNVTATVELLAGRGHDVVLLGAGEGADFRCEDKMATARLGASLVARGFVPDGHETADTIKRWGATDTALLGWGRSAEHLRRSGHADDLEFVLGHVDDLDLACRYVDGEIAPARPGPAAVRGPLPLEGEAAI